MAKTATHSIALAIPPPAGGDRILLVLRPADDEALPKCWALPAATLKRGESEAQAVVRLGSEKLGILVRQGELVGELETDSAERSRRMRVHEGTIASGSPEVSQRHEGTQYVDWRWAEPGELKAAARGGSLGAQILLRARQVAW